ncbi:hypothetical protein H0H93_013228 [Arthromyces matolae]|nr:hypothetical protein H0H93_013228 [Arthromyces matolae]
MLPIQSFSRLFLLISAGLFGVATAVTIGPVAHLDIVNKEIAPDGFLRPTVLAGGTFPGPVIAGKKGDVFTINVTDHLTDPSMLRSTTIHWHGIFQNGSNYADGPAMVTQLERSGIILIIPLSTVMGFVEHSSCMTQKTLNEDDLHNYQGTKPPGKPQLGGANIVVPIRQQYFAENRSFEINNVTFTSPSVPVLLQILNGTYDEDALLPKGSIYKLKPNSSVELQIWGLSVGGPHAFYVIKNADSEVYNWNNPVLRDTVTTGLDGNLTVLRFFTDNSGPWFLHWRVSHFGLTFMGLAIVFAEDPEGTKKHIKPIPPPFYELCPKYDQFNPDPVYIPVPGQTP